MLAHARQPSLEQLSPQRRSITAAALRKGQIKISEPLPLDSTGPSPVWNPSSTSHRQSQFPSVYGQHDQPRPTDADAGFQAPVMSVGPDPHSSASNFQSGGPLPEPSMPAPSDATATPDAYNSLPPGSAMGDGPQPRHKRSSPSVKDSRDGPGNRPDSQSAHVTAQPRMSITPSSRDFAMDSPAKKKRRSGSIRGAFKRMFSKREKQEKSAQIQEPPQSRGRGPHHEYHSSEPPFFPVSRGGLDKVNEEASSPGQPHVREVKKDAEPRARSPVDTPRLPFPMNIHGDQPAPYNPNRSRTNFETSPQPHRRRATLPSLILSPAEAAALSKFWDHRGSIAPSEPHSDPNDAIVTPAPLIGLAITSNVASKRRSRSADALRDLAGQQDRSVDLRRRSAEIRHLRSPELRIQEIEEEETFPQSQRASIVEFAPAPKAPTPTPPRHPVVDVTDEQIHDEDEDEEAGRATDTTRVPRSDSPHSTEQMAESLKQEEPLIRVDKRLSQLEINMTQLTRSMQALSGRQPSASFKLQKPPPSRGRSTGEPETDDHHLAPPVDMRDAAQLRRSASMKYPPSPKVIHPRASPSLNDFNVRTEQFDATERVPTAIPLDDTSPMPNGEYKSRQNHSRGTVTPPNQVQNFSTPFGSSKDSPSRLIDQLAPLYSALQYERSVRKQLEITVLQLQRDLLNITNIIAEMRGLGAYPTPSPDHVLGMMRHRKPNHAEIPPDLVHGHEDDDLMDDSHDEYVGLNSPSAWATPLENRDMGNEDWPNEMF